MVAINANLPSGVRPGQLLRRELIAEGDRACAWLSDQASRKSTGTLVGTYREFSRAVAPHSDWRFGNGYLSFRADVARGGWFYLCPDVLQRQIPNADD